MRDYRQSARRAGASDEESHESSVDLWSVRSLDLFNFHFPPPAGSHQSSASFVFIPLSSSYPSVHNFGMKLLLLSLFYNAALVFMTDQTHGFSTTSTIRLSPCTRRRWNNGGHRAAPSFLNIKVKTTLLAFSNNDESNRDPLSPMKTLIDTIQSNPSRSIYFSSLMTICGAALGPFLDSYHSLFGVLTYNTPLVFPILSVRGEGPGSLLTCVTTYWVPPLFGLAGFLIGWLYILLDAIFSSKESGAESDQLHPSIPKVLIGISYFTFQYYLSGIIFANGVDRMSILVLMSTLAAGGFYALDGTVPGFITSAATAIGGPLIEVALISSLPGSWGYHYNDAGETGFFTLWIVPVYFLGGPANGNLARVFWDVLGKDNNVSLKKDNQIPPVQKKGPHVLNAKGPEQLYAPTAMMEPMCHMASE